MTFTQMHEAARRRLKRGDESGYALIFVLLITMLIMAGVATMLTVVASNVAPARRSQDDEAALAAAEAGIQNFLAFLLHTPSCAARVCNQALQPGNSGSSPTSLPGTDETYRWYDTTQLDSQTVRVHATGTAGGVNGATRTLVADIRLATSILSFGYYTDYESQAPSFLYDYFDNRKVYISSSTAYNQIDASDTRGRTIDVTAPSTVSWNGPPTSGTNPNPASMCGEHWYAEAGSPGRASYGQNSVWGETGSINSRSLMRDSSCDVVFTSGMTFDGPLYTRDALLISDQTKNGVGPIFKEPVQSLWGYRSGTVSYDNPNVPGSPWRQDSSVGGLISSQSPYAPVVASADLSLPKDVGTAGLPDNPCIYRGPTRVKLNGDGTATVTSPGTTVADPQSDPNCYPTGSLASGVLNFTLHYQSVGNGAIYVKDLGTEPATGWPTTGTKSTVAATPTNSVFYLSANAGTVSTPDQPDSSLADESGCSSTVKYKNVASWPCAWTNVATTTDGGSSLGWTAYTTSRQCNSGSLSSADRQQFECDWSNKTSGLPAGTGYATLRSNMKRDIAGCTVAATAATCVKNAVTADLAAQPSLNTSSHRYIVNVSTGAASQGASQSVGSQSPPAAPMSGDSMFTSTSTPAQEAATKTPITVTVSRQTYSCSLLNLLGLCIGTWNWGGDTPQFTLTDTVSNWAVKSQPQASSYFPNNQDVTQYWTGTAGATGANGPGDLYVDGNNQGQLSLIAQNDVVVTGDIKDTSTDPRNDAVDIVAGNDVRNYHPVSCVDETALDINNTTAGWCPNDITGLYVGASGMENNGVLTSAHPAMQYSNMNGTGARRIDAAIFALSGSFMTDNYNRGAQIGNLTVNGGLYQSHRGANGVQWEYQNGDTKRASSGYSLQYHYVNLGQAELPYIPPVDGPGNGHVWNVVSISSGSS